MALPTVPPLTLAQVRAEFGAPSTATLNDFLRGGPYVPNTGTNAGVPTALPIKLLDLLGATNTPPINVTNHTVVGVQFDEPNEFPPPASIWTTATAYIVVMNTGGLRAGYSDGVGANTETTVDIAGEWLVSGAPAAYDVRATLLSGTLTGGSAATGAWLNCGTNHLWEHTHSGPGSSSAVVRLEFCAAGNNGANILDTCDITLTGQRP